MASARPASPSPAPVTIEESSWGALLDRAAADPSRGPLTTEIVATGRAATAWPLCRRAHVYAELVSGRFKPNAFSLTLPPASKEAFALAMFDVDSMAALSNELPQIAAAFRLSHDAALLARVLAQLEEAASWSPLQRTGWHSSASAPDVSPRDGAWLATGTGVRAIADTLEILPAEVVPPALAARLRALLTSEIAGVQEDWRVKRMWFVRSDNPRTNQWVFPTEGLLRAALVTGDRDAYEIAVQRLLRTLDALGPAGEFDEGLSYAIMTTPSLLSAARAAAASGDRRLIDHAYFVRLATWLAQHLQPGQALINAFDSRFSRATPARHAQSSPPPGTDDGGKALRGVFAQLCMTTGSPVARWALERLGGPPADLAGLGALLRGGPSATPPTFAAYDRARRVSWRSSWDEDATGVWVRGGHALDQHDHEDRGHVSFILRGRPALIEAGTTTSYAQMSPAFRSVAGHNVLALGNTGQRARCVAPIAVQRLDALGGRVVVDASSCYADASSWIRDVSWTADQLEVVDRVHAIKHAPIALRWHTGSEAPVTITGSGTRYTIAWPGVTVTLDATRPLQVTQAPAPDQTLGLGTAGSPHTHACVLVRAAPAVDEITISTRVRRRKD